MNRWSTSLLRIVFALSVLFSAGIFSFLVGAISHSQTGLLPSIAFLGAFFCLLLLLMRLFPSVYSGSRRPRPWWRTRAIEVPIGMGLAIIISILSSRIAMLWFGLLSISALLIALLLRVTNKGGESQGLLAKPDSVPDDRFDVADHAHARPNPRLAGIQIHRAVKPIRLWRTPPFFIPDNYAIDVRNLAVACEWYTEKLGLHQARDQREDDSGRPFADVQISDDAFVSLVELPPGVPPDNRHVIFFARNLEKAHRWLAHRGILVEPITIDSGGNRLFRLRDLEGNVIEVCVEPE